MPESGCCSSMRWYVRQCMPARACSLGIVEFVALPGDERFRIRRSSAAQKTIEHASVVFAAQKTCCASALCQKIGPTFASFAREDAGTVYCPSPWKKLTLVTLLSTRRRLASTSPSSISARGLLNASLSSRLDAPVLSTIFIPSCSATPRLAEIGAT